MGLSWEKINTPTAAIVEAPASPTTGANIRHIVVESVVVAGMFSTGSIPGIVITSVFAGDAGVCWKSESLGPFEHTSVQPNSSTISTLSAGKLVL